MERNRSVRTAVVVCVLGLTLSAAGYTRTIYVDDDAPADFGTIQAAVDDANDGDTIIIQPGTYSGGGNRDIDFKGKAITLKSEGGPQTCIIDCQGTKNDPHRGFILRSPGQGTAVLDGFTVTNGYTEYGGGGLQMERGCVVRNCVVTGNYVERGGGGGISLSGGTVVNCVITNNLAGREGVRASGGGIGAGSGRWNVVDPLIINCTIVGNKATDKGGGIACGYNGIAGMENCIVVGNRASTASQIWAYDEMKEPVAMKLRARNCCIQSDSCADIWQRSCAQSSLGGSTLTVEEVIYTDDPGFVNPAQGDFRLRPDSPCVDRGTVATSAGLPETDLVGNPRVADGDRDGAVRPDLGAYEVPAPDEPYLWASALSLRFTPPAEGLAPEPQTLTVRNLGAKASHWVARSDCDWLTLTPDGGSSDEGSARMTVSVDTRGLEGGSYTCNITISDADASNSPLTIPVTLSARFRHVPDEYATIQQAVDAADPYDTIVVADGVYHSPDNEGITCRGKPLTIRSANGPEGCRIQRSAGTYAQTFAFVFDRRDRHCIVDGFTIVGCDPAIQCEGSSSLAIRSCHIVGGKNLSGITVRLSDVTMEDCTLADCRLGLNGRWSSIQVFRCAFRNNDTAVICEEACALQLDGCDVSDSWAKAIDFSFCNELRMTNCSIRGTQARGTSSWAIGCSNTFSVVVESCLISGNRLGGLLLSSCQDVTIRDSILSGNGAYGVGSLSNLAIRNCTFVGNKGAGLLYYGPYWRDPAAEVTNSIFWANTPDQITDNTASLAVTYSNIQAGWAGTGNIDTDPLFAEPGYRDPNGTPDDPNDDFWVEGDYHLKSQVGRWETASGSWVVDEVTSPCIDAGDPNSPVGDEPEPNGGRVNLGAYGGTAEASMSYLTLAKVIYVDDDAGAGGDGVSWWTAYGYLQDALADAKAAEKPAEIRVAQGTYKPDRGVGFVRGDRRATFRLINGVALRGGYAGLAGADPDARDVKQYESILSGDLHDNDPEVDDLADLLNVNVGNSRTVVTGSGTDSTAVLDGFTVTRGYFVISHLQPEPGAAGMHNLTGSPTVLRCTFTRNASTGSAAMYNRQGSNPTLIDCVFTRNYALMGSAGIANRNSNPKLVGCIFRDNDSRDGAAMYNRESSPVVDTCTLVRNSGFEGGAIHNLQSSPTLIGCLFQENTASVGGAVFNDEGSTLTVNACIFTGNSAMYGGAVNDRHPSVNSTISNCIFRMNLASRYAGALFVNNASVTNCIFAGNRALRLPPDPEHPSIGGAILTSTITLTNCTFDGNWAEFGRAIFGSRVSAQAYNCIFWGSEDLIYCDYLAPPIDVRYSNIQHGWPGEGNIDTDPCFVRFGRWADPDDPNRAAEPNDPNAIWVDGDYRLRSQAGRWDPAAQNWVVDDVTSPCIDTGDPNSPIGEEPFPNGGRINMGIYGGTAEASKSYVSP